MHIMDPDRVLETLDEMLRAENELNEGNGKSLRERTRQYYAMLGSLGLAGGGPFWRRRFHWLRRGLLRFRRKFK